MQTKKTEIWVGVFLLVALLAALFVCLKAAKRHLATHRADLSPLCDFR